MLVVVRVLVGVGVVGVGWFERYDGVEDGINPSGMSAKVANQIATFRSHCRR